MAAQFISAVKISDDGTLIIDETTRKKLITYSGTMAVISIEYHHDCELIMQAQSLEYPIATAVLDVEQSVLPSTPLGRGLLTLMK